MKRLLTILLSLTTFTSFSQVGISTNSSFTPTSTLDVDGTINAVTSYKIGNSVGTSGNFLRSDGTTGFVSSTIQASDVPTLNQNTTGSAGSVLNSLTLNNGGSGDITGTLFNGSSSVTLSYNTIGGWGIFGNAGTTVGTNFIGTTDNVGLSFKTNNTEQMRLQSGGQLTIGSTSSGAKLDVHQTTGTAVGRFTTYGNTNDIELRRTGGTQASPTATSGSGTVLGRLLGQGYNGTSYTTAASISFQTDAAGGTSTDMPGAIVFNTTPDGSGTLTEKMRINNGGAISFGGSANTGTAGQVLTSQGSSASPIWATTSVKFQIPYMQRFQSASSTGYFYNGTGYGWNTYSTSLYNATSTTTPSSLSARSAAYYGSYVATTNCTFVQFRGVAVGESLNGGQVEVSIYKFTPVNNSSAAMTGTLIGSATVTLTTSLNNYTIQFNGNGSAALSAGDIVVVFCRTPNWASGTWYTDVNGSMEFSY